MGRTYKRTESALSKRDKERHGARLVGYVYEKNHTRFGRTETGRAFDRDWQLFRRGSEGRYYFVGSGGGGGGGYGIRLSAGAKWLLFTCWAF